MTPLRARPFLRSDWAGFAGICVFAILLRIPIAGIPLERDEGGYAYIAQRWVQGDLPYRDAFEKKPPGAYVAYALLEHTVGTSVSAIHWGTQVYTLGTLALLFMLGGRLCSPTAGLAAAAFAAFMTTAPSVLGNSANTEVFMILPLTAAMLAACATVERGSLAAAFLTGVLAGLALVFKQVAISNVVFHAVFVMWLARRRRLIAPTLLLGLVMIPALASLYFAWQGTWDAYWDAVIGHGVAYANRLQLAQYPEALWRTLPGLLWSFWPLLVLAGGQVVAAFLRPASRAATPGSIPLRRNTVWVLLWLVASFTGTAFGGYFRAHYFVQLIPPLAILAGMAVSHVSASWRRAPLRRLATIGLVVIPIGIGVLSDLWYYSPGDVAAKSARLYGAPFFAESLDVGAFIAAHSGAEDSVFVLGSEPQILYYAVRKSATRYIFVHPLTGPFPDARERQLEALRDVAAAAPRLIVTVFLPSSFAAEAEPPADIFDGTRDIISRSYRVAAVLGMSPDGASVPLLTGAQAEAAWQTSPGWYGSPSLWALAVWQRVPPRPDADRASADAENSLGVGLTGRGDITGAVAHYREAIRLDPDFAAAYNNLAAALAGSGQLDQAIEQYTAAIRLSPLHPEPHANLAVLLQQAGRLPEAIAHFRAALQLNPRHVELRYRLAITYTQVGAVGDAEAEFTEVLRERPVWAAAEATLAWLLATAEDARLRNGTHAVQLAEDAARQTQQSDANVLNSLAAAYAEVGRYPQAANIATHALDAARRSGQTELQEALAARLGEYRAGRPVRERPGDTHR